MGSTTSMITSGLGVANAIGGGVPVISTIGSLVSGASNFYEASQEDGNLEAEQDLALQQLQAEQALEMQQLEQDAALKQEQIDAAAAQAEDARKKALKRAVASQRASFGSQGLGDGSSNSSEAVLLGLFEESEDERRVREENDALKAKALDQNLEDQKSLNLLQTTQLQQRQSLQSLY